MFAITTVWRTHNPTGICFPVNTNGLIGIHSLNYCYCNILLQQTSGACKFYLSFSEYIIAGFYCNLCYLLNVNAEMLDTHMLVYLSQEEIRSKCICVGHLQWSYCWQLSVFANIFIKVKHIIICLISFRSIFNIGKHFCRDSFLFTYSINFSDDHAETYFFMCNWRRNWSLCLTARWAYSF